MNDFDRIARIDLDTFSHNLSVLKKHVATHESQNGACTHKIMACIKSNAYGHGLLPTAYALSQAGCEGFAVADIHEAILLRQANLSNRILLMSSTLTDSALGALSEHRIDWVLFHPQHIAQLESITLPKPIHVWLKINTGMNRMGLDPDAIPEAYRRLTQNKNVQGTPVLMSHFASADQKPSKHVANQYARFISTTAPFKTPRSLANSAALLNYPETAMDWSRPGLALYGGSPLANKTGQALGLKPIMNVQAKLISVHDAKPGDYVGYSGWWQCKNPTRIGVVAFGYADGYPRQMPHGAPVWLHNKPAKTLGRTSMDTLIIDLNQVPQAQIGDWVTLWGNNLPAESLAKRAGSSMYQLTCNLSQRVARHYIWQNKTYDASQIKTLFRETAHHDR
jgi:alanine racemase